MKSIIFKGHTCAPQDYQLTILAYPFSITVCLLSEEMCGTHCHHKWFVNTCACACMYMTTLTLRLRKTKQHNTTQLTQGSHFSVYMYFVHIYTCSLVLRPPLFCRKSPGNNVHDSQILCFYRTCTCRTNSRP